MLSLIVTSHLYPRLAADRFPAGRLTKVRARAVSGRSCRAVGERLGLPERLETAAPPEAGPVADLVRADRLLAEVVEAVIGACYLAFGFAPTSVAVLEAFAPEIESALEHPEDAKSELQELLARRGDLVRYDVSAEAGPPHDRRFEVTASVGDTEVGRGSGRSKKEAEQVAAAAALAQLGT